VDRGSFSIGVAGGAAGPFDDLPYGPLIDVESHVAVFAWILQRLADAGPVKGKIVGIDATAVEGERRAAWHRGARYRALRGDEHSESGCRPTRAVSISHC